MTKQDLYTYLETTLKSITEIKAVERWKNQVIDKARSDLPAAYIELVFQDITEISGQYGVRGDVNNGVQTIIQSMKFNINIHIYDKTFEDNRDYENIYDIEQLIYLALQGKSASDYMTPLIRIGMEENDTLGTIDNTMVTFSTTITDDSATTGRTVIKTTEKPIVTRGTV